jgi:hypothetical protein
LELILTEPAAQDNPPLAGAAACPHCGMDLGSTEIQQAWRSLLVADQWVARAREVRSGVPAAAAPTPAPPVPRRRLSAGTVLLVLGAVSLLVAGLIFITVSWGSLGIVGRALALLAFTTVVGGLAHVLTRRALRASAEALWTVFLGLLTLDWFAARDQGLFGLDALPGGYAAGIWGAVVLVAGIAIAKAGRQVHRAGGSLRDVQGLAGHRSIEVTQRYIEGDTPAKRRLVHLL